MNHLFRRRCRELLVVALCAFGGLLAIAPVAAQSPTRVVSSADVSAVRKIIQAQFDAFAADDAKAAFAFATSGLRELFGTPEQFMVLVRTNYPAVYRHAGAIFSRPEWAAGVLVQEVHITDSNGALWLALYQLEPQADHTWRIGGCQISRAKGVST